jgi:hypothetical protein
MGLKKSFNNHSGGIVLRLLFGILLVMLVGGGLALATYLGFISMDSIADKARQIPIVAKYYPSKTAAFPTGEEMAVSEQQTQPGQMESHTGVISKKPALQSLAKSDTMDTVDKATAEELKNMSRLARLYASMKPEESVPILKELDDALVVSMLRKMEDEQAARILAMMEPQRAATLTRILVNVNKTGNEPPGLAR